MVEHTLVVDQLKLQYVGPFQLSVLYRVMTEWAYGKGYAVLFPQDNEFTTPQGRQHKIKLVFAKAIIEEVQLRIPITIYVIDAHPKDIVIDGVSKTFDEATVKMYWDGVVRTDRHSLWSGKPLLWFLNILRNKYLLKGYMTQAEEFVVHDLEQLYQHVKQYLNLTVQQKHRGVITPYWYP